MPLIAESEPDDDPVAAVAVAAADDDDDERRKRDADVKGERVFARLPSSNDFRHTNTSPLVFTPLQP